MPKNNPVSTAAVDFVLNVSDDIAYAVKRAESAGFADRIDPHAIVVLTQIAANYAALAGLAIGSNELFREREELAVLKGNTK